MGWLDKKTWIQHYVELMSRSGSPQYVARGAAIGVFCAFVVPFSQMALALLLAVFLRAARFPALLFTWISNPFTIAFIYPLQCFVGSHLLGEPLSYHRAELLFSDLIRSPSLQSVLALGDDLLVPFFFGGLVLGLLFALLGYLIVIRLVKQFRARRHVRRLQRKKQIARKRKNREKEKEPSA